MRFDNVLTRMLGVKYPIIQGAFGWPETGMASLAVPVSEAGGLGILTTLCYKNPDQFQEDVRKAKSMTDKPFAVNFSMSKDMKKTMDYHEEYIRITLEEGIQTVFTSGYDGTEIGGRIFKKEGCNWIHKCAAIEHAVSISRKGVDAVVLVGLEGTGAKSPKQNTTLINMTSTRRLVQVPLIAAGGIGDARGFVAALAMGAVGIYMGTAFMATREFQAPDTLKSKIVDQAITDADYCRKIYDMDHGGHHSLASGVIESVPTIKEFIEGIVREAEEIMAELKEWGMLD
jgi:nitronate monooxygenase